MKIQVRSSSLQTYQAVLYDRTLHPELFQMRSRRVVSHGRYELEVWLMPGSHLLRFELDQRCICELVTDQESGLPSTGILAAFPCAGERDYEHEFKPWGVTYMTTVQTETLSETLYVATFKEMSDFAAQNEALTHEWQDSAGRCMSIVDIQWFDSQIHAQSYHLLAQGGLVLRTQSIFEHA